MSDDFKERLKKTSKKLIDALKAEDESNPTQTGIDWDLVRQYQLKMLENPVILEGLRNLSKKVKEFKEDLKKGASNDV